ncbi:MAG: hypothetical protein RJB66_1447 [Pseudomonadota bacterium]|jgi:segregation and condensation protein B
MAKKKTPKIAEDAAVNADLSNLIDAAKSSLFEFDSETDESPVGAEKAKVFESDEVEEIQTSMALLTEEDLQEIENIVVGEDISFDEENLFASLDGETIDSLETKDVSSELEGTELEGFDSASIEELEFVEESQLESIIESVLFATDRPVSLATLKQIFKGTNVSNARLKRAIESLQVEYAGGRRGVTLEEVGSGYQLRTKIDNMEFMRRSFKAKAFKVSGPALEVLAIVAYKQPVVKAEIDEIRGVESGHLLRALMEKNLVLFAGKSDLPGKPMQYATTRKFLEIFGLRNLKELPTLSQIDELLPEGIGDEEQKPKLADITDGLSEKIGSSYSEGEEELTRITDQLEKIETSSEFFEKEKIRQKLARDEEKARNLREALAVGETVSTRDVNWLKKYDEQLAQVVAAPEGDVDVPATEVAAAPTGALDESAELEAALQAWDAESAQDDLDFAQRLEDNDIADIDEEIV